MSVNPESLHLRMCSLCGSDYYVENIHASEKGLCEDCEKVKDESDELDFRAWQERQRLERYQKLKEMEKLHNAN